MTNAKILITDDLFDIVNRLKEINMGYYLLFDVQKNKYEVHNGNQSGSSYCLSLPYDFLDWRTLELAEKSQSRFAEQIYKDMDIQNALAEKTIDQKSKLNTLLHYEEILKNKTKY